jgi:ABC-2 type transport system permease protein
VRQNATALWTLVTKEYFRIVRIWVQTLVPPAITMSLYFVIFGNLIGRRIGEMDGFGYMQFIAPGLIMMSVITNSYGNVVSSFFGAKFARHIEEMLVSPMPASLILLGHVAGGVIRGLLVGFLVTLVFALAGLINAIFAKKFDDISIIPTFVLTPLTYLGGVFYSISLLPDFWQKVSLANPVLYMVNAFRYGILGVSDIPIDYAYFIIGVFIVSLYSFALLLLKRGVGIRE